MTTEISRLTNKAQTLVEVIIALGAAVIIVTAITKVVIASLANTQFSRDQVIATQYAQEGIEFMKRMKVTNWSTFNTYATGTYCLGGDISSISSLTSAGTGCGVNVGNIYVRTIYILRNSSFCLTPTVPAPSPTTVPTNGTQITSTVSWTDPKCTDANTPYCHSTKHSTCFSDYGLIPGP